MDLNCKLHELKQMDLKDAAQKANVNWAIEGDENSKFFHGVINKRRSQLAIRGVFVSGDWYTNPSKVKEVFYDHFAARFKQPSRFRLKLSMPFPNRLSPDQVGDLDNDISLDEIRKAVWDCGESKSPSCFLRGGNSSFIALFPRQILDGPFILNEVLAWCKRKRKQALVFKVDFAKAYDSVRWDFLLDVFKPLFPIFSGLKQGDPLAPFLFILVMESLHLSVRDLFTNGYYKGFNYCTTSLSHLFYADDAVFIGEWSSENLDNLLMILRCFQFASGPSINVNKSHLLGVGVPLDIVHQGASRIGCEVMRTPFKYLGVMKISCGLFLVSHDGEDILIINMKLMVIKS
ncbi:RNA-directed DNA polymerase, eukaryota [Tanacetum coccineum]